MEGVVLAYYYPIAFLQDDASQPKTEPELPEQFYRSGNKNRNRNSLENLKDTPSQRSVGFGVWFSQWIFGGYCAEIFWAIFHGNQAEKIEKIH